MNNKKGFTLAELLVVVAIIAVLVGISIPVFTSQLEKAREATDLANIRSAYAELMTCVITGDSDVDTSKTNSSGANPLRSNSNIYYVKNDYFTTYSIEVNMKQTIDNWQTSNAVDSLKELFSSYGDDDIFENVGKDKTAIISYTITNNSSVSHISFY